MTRATTTLRLVPVATTAWLTAAGTTLVPASAPHAAGALWLGSIVIVGLSWRRRRRPGARRLHLIVLFAFAAAAAVASHVMLAQPARTEIGELALEGGRAVTVHATVTGKIERRVTGELAFDALATRISYGAVVREVHVEVVVQVRPGDIAGSGILDVGGRVEARGTATAADPGDRAVLRVRASRGLTVLQPPSGLLAATADLRRGLTRSVQGLPQPAAGLIPGLAVGDTSAVDSALDASMKQSSLSHLTAVSGANCALVVGIAFAIAAACGARRATRVFVGLVALAGFIVLVTPEPSVVRAGAMAAVAMLSVLLARPAAGMAVLSLAVTVLLIADPWLATSLGFALSSVATASLLLFAAPLAHGLGRWMPRALALAMAVPLAAQLACGPLLVLISPSVPLYGLVANMLAAPAAPIATVIGLLACLSAPVPALQAGFSAIAWLPAAWISSTARTFAELPGNQAPWWEGGVGLLALSVLGGAVGVLIGVRRGSDPIRRVARSAAGTILALTVGIGVGGAALSSVIGSWTIPRGWSVIACDVGQGDAILIRSAAATALVDAGPDPARLESCLRRAGIERLDLLVLTHFDLDHVGGVPAVIGRVGTVVHGPAVAETDAAVIGALTQGGAAAVDARAGVHGNLGAADWRVLWPPARSAAFTSGNDASVVVDIRGGGVPTMLMLGDLSASPQRALAASALLSPPYDVVKVAHHGSADQAPELYAATRAAVALITVGAENDYGHPRADTLRLLATDDMRIARTDGEGMIALWLDGGALRVWRDRAGDVGPAG